EDWYPLRGAQYPGFRESFEKLAPPELVDRLNYPARAGGRADRPEVSGLTGLWLSKPNPQTGAPDGRDEPSAPPHDRGHDGPQSVAGDATILRVCGGEVQPAFWPLAGAVGPQGRARLSGPSGGERHLLAAAHPNGLRAGVFLRHHPRAGQDPGTHPLRPRAAQAADRVERR